MMSGLEMDQAYLTAPEPAWLQMTKSAKTVNIKTYTMNNNYTSNRN